MMSEEKYSVIPIKIPHLGGQEGKTLKALLTSWPKKEGDFVQEGDSLCEIESDKATIELPAEAAGFLKIFVPEGKEVERGAVIGQIVAKN